ncbi:hypothetical protein [Acidaminobacter hydrogenoformans]|uniref:hypothetical protein n=1 Tax=Acidaminobacter hydrogenoformans TaxID=65403 RepID=UPI0038BC93E1
MLQWIAREYLARRGTIKFGPGQLNCSPVILERQKHLVIPHLICRMTRCFDLT